MSVKEIRVRVYICDNCGMEIKNTDKMISLDNDCGTTTIIYLDRTYQLEESHFCGLDCFLNNLRTELLH
jgi:hypothetical protein